MNHNEEFSKERSLNLENQGGYKDLKEAGLAFLSKSLKYKYSYQFDWLNRPIIQYPQDIVAIQELIWKTKPDIVIETGIAHGGSLVLSASILELLGGEGFVIGVDIDIREHNRSAIVEHPMSRRIKMIQGSSIDKETISKVYELIPQGKKVMVILDSNHTHDHVKSELEAYAPLVTPEQYLVVFDTVIEDLADDFIWSDRPWGKGNNPKTAVWEFLKKNDQFEIDQDYNNKLLISVAPDGYLRRVK